MVKHKACLETCAIFKIHGNSFRWLYCESSPNDLFKIGCIYHMKDFGFICDTNGEPMLLCKDGFGTFFVKTKNKTRYFITEDLRSSVVCGTVVFEDEQSCLIQTDTKRYLITDHKRSEVTKEMFVTYKEFKEFGYDSNLKDFLSAINNNKFTYLNIG